MAGSKAESEFYFSLALRHIFEGDSLTALEILYKAEKIHPSDRAKDLIAHLEKLGASARDDSQEANSSNENVGGSGGRAREPSPPRRYEEEEARGKYTEEELLAVQRIKGCSNFYEILEVGKEAEEAEIKSAYRRLAKQLHPDKNKAPGTTEAFKVINHAFEVLSDKQKRKQFDNIFKCASDYRKPKEPATKPSQKRHKKKSSSKKKEPPQSRPKWFDKILLCIPILGLLCATISYFQSPSVNYQVTLPRTVYYSLERSQEFPYEMHTRNLRLLYFVKHKSQANERLEKEVETEHVDNLKTACSKERNYKESLLRRATGIGDPFLEKKAKAVDTPSCTILTDLYVYGKIW